MATLPNSSDQTHPLTRLHVWQIQAVRDVLVVLIIIALVWAGYTMRAVTVPLLVALLLAYLFEPLVSSLTRRFKASRPVVVSGILITVGLSVLLVLAVTIPFIVSQTMRFVHDARAGRFEAAVLQLREYVPAEFRSDFERAASWLTPEDAAVRRQSQPAKPEPSIEVGDGKPSIPSGESEPPREDVQLSQPSVVVSEDERIRQLIREELAGRNRLEIVDADQPTMIAPIGAGAGEWWDWGRSGAQRVGKFLGGLIELGLLAFLIPFYFFFFSVSYPAVQKFGREMLPLNNRAQTLELIARMDRAIAGFVRGRIIICMLMGVMLALGWFIVGVPYAVVLGLVIGAFCIVPYLGGIGLPLAIGLLAFDQLQLPETERMGWIAIFIWPTVVFSIVQVIESYLLTPMIAGKATNLDPVTILVAVLAGGSVGGVYGMILAIPLAACLKIVWVDVLLPKVRAWSRGEIKDPLPGGPSQ